MTTFKLFICVLLSSLVLPRASSQTVSDEARRHFDRGITAVEMAKMPSDYKSAIQEFQEAARLAPDWPDVYYNLGQVQEKAEDYRGAVASLKRYLELAPGADDAAEVKVLINKLEYKADQVLTPKDYTDIFLSLANSQIWEEVGKQESCPACLLFLPGIPARLGDNVVRVVALTKPDPSGSSDGIYSYKDIIIDGNRISYHWQFYECIPDRSQSCLCYQNNEIEIVNRNLVRIEGTRYLWRAGGGPVHFSYEYRRK